MNALTKKSQLIARIEGYASVYNCVDLSGDVVLPGALIEKNQKNFIHPPLNRLMMLYQHKVDCPIGRWTKMQDHENGLFVTGELLLGSQKASEVYELLRGGAINGLSIGFRIKKARKGNKGIRIIEKADLWEVSIVSFPMAQDARITFVGDPEVCEQEDPVRAGLSAQTARRASFPPSGARHFAKALRDAAGIMSRV